MILALLLACTAIDGDTIRCPGIPQRIRIADIDTPELRARCPAEAALARRARDRLAELLRGGEVRLIGTRRDRYGRHLREVWVGRMNVGRRMVLEGHARVYRGRRESWC